MIQASHEVQEDTAARSLGLRQEQAAQRCRVHLPFSHLQQVVQH